MKELTDEILNKYIDNELNTNEISELKKFLSENPDELEKFKAHNLLDDILREMEFDSAPSNFTESFMQKLYSTFTEKSQKHYFIWSVLSFLGLCFVGIFVFGITNISSSESSPTNKIFDSIGEGLNNVIPKADSFNFTIDSDLLMLIVSTLVLVTLLATYALIKSHKAFKDKIENLSH